MKELRTNTARALAALDREWRALLDAIASVPDGALTAPGVVEGWSVRDLIGHVSTWEREFLKAMSAVLDGGRLPTYRQTYGSIDAFNAQEHERNAALPLAELRRQMDETHAALLAALQGVPDEALSSKSRLRRRLRLDTYGHYREHAAQIRARADRMT
jgi:uncharacterized protein (TIGR03083 family)